LVDYLASRRTDVVVAVSDRLAEQLSGRVVSDPERVQVVINGVDTAALRPDPTGEARTRLGIPPGSFVIGSVGRMEPVKGYDVMIEALISLREMKPELPVVLVLVGDGSERPKLEERVRNAGVSDAVRFLGWREDVVDLYRGFDLFALTSRSEGTSVSILEAMSSGLCPVVTDVGGNRAVVGPELAHRLVPSEDPNMIALGWVTAFERPAERQADGLIGRRRVEDRFSLRAMVAAYEALYSG
jgi:glycosyltransferase involved in cell wall biosynthesis